MPIFPIFRQQLNCLCSQVFGQMENYLGVVKLLSSHHFHHLSLVLPEMSHFQLMEPQQLLEGYYCLQEQQQGCWFLEADDVEQCLQHMHFV